jgi:hypothetical protein
MVMHDRPNLSMPLQAYNTSAPIIEPSHANDALDDVFGSAPSSPSHEDTRHDGSGNTEVSDIPRLKEKHETEGYRDGVTQGKAKTVQQGFDEGHNLGAVMGLRIGKILGLVEGLWAAVKSAESSASSGEVEKWEDERERLGGLVQNARLELRIESVFGREWWGEDGIWKYAVPGEGEGMDVVFTDVAAAHPLIKKWEAVVDEEVVTWAVDLTLMEHEREQEEETTTKESDAPTSTAPGAKKELSW